ncbi:MAG: secretin N-terminal domain-containing protein [Candidatus Omnitrophota bacterium]|nr:secretin N-terminal domain-containing protein [Candidatus Omnitrophota bacterium]
MNPKRRWGTFSKLFCVLIIIVCFNVTLLAEELTGVSPQTPQIQENPGPDLSKLSLDERFNQLISLDLRNIDVIETLKYIATKGGLNIVTSKNVAGRVSLTLENVPLKDIFDLILRANGLAYVKLGEIYNVMTEAEYKAFYGKNFFDTRQVKVFRLKYAIPEQAFTFLDALKSEIGRVLVDQESGNVLLMDTAERIGQIQVALEEFERQNTVEVFTLKYAKAKEVEDILKTQLDLKKVGSIKSDERNNQVIVQTLAERMQEISRLIHNLDKPTKQVLIDTKIVKIKLSNQLDSGLEWEGIFNVVKNKLGTTYVGSYPFSQITAGQTTPTFKTRSDVLGNLTASNSGIGSYPFSGTTSSLNTSTKVSPGEKMHLGIITENRDFDTLINYLDTVGKTRVLANPKLVVVNNQEAKIHIGERQAYVTTTTTTGQATSTIAEEVQFVDIGIQLSVTANINDDGYITMKVKPEISSVSSVLITPTNNRIPIIDTSIAETTVMMKDGTTLLIGGLRKEEKILSSEEMPFASRIPFLGFFFKRATDKTDRTELLVMLTPHIISGKELTTGDERVFGTQPGKEPLEYQPITPDKSLLPGAPLEVVPKTYQDYLGLKEEPKGQMLSKGTRYESPEKFSK